MTERKGEKEDERLEMRALPSVAVCFPLVFAWLPGARAQQCSESGDGTCSAPRRPAGVFPPRLLAADFGCNFRRLVLGCSKAKFRKKICV